MGIAYNPKIITNGLISHIDAGNRKSFSGIGTERLNGIVPAFGVFNGLVGTSTAYTSRYGPGVYLNVTTGGGVNWWNSNNGQQACSASTQYVITARVRYTGGTPSANLFYVRQYNSGGTQTSEGGKYDPANQIELGDGYYLVWAYFTTDTTAATFLVQGYEYGIIQIWLEDVECRLSGLADISGRGNNGALFGAINRVGTFGGAIQLGTSDNISTGLNLSSGAYTVIAAARYTGGGTNRRIITSSANNWLMGHWNATSENYYAEGWVSGAGVGANDTAWRIFACTGNTSTDTWQMYVNGVQTYSNSLGVAGPNNLGINLNESSNCQVGFLMVYNRPLTDAEIKQNYLVFRKRYSIGG